MNVIKFIKMLLKGVYKNGVNKRVYHEKRARNEIFRFATMGKGYGGEIGKMKLKQLKENQIYRVRLECHSTKWSRQNEEIGESLLLFGESQTTSNINNFLLGYGFEFEEMDNYTEHGLEDQKNRFVYSQVVKEQGQEYIEDYDLYIEIATLNSEVLE